jgi:heme/copper-type cytochrome/quinol oxidase subunit 2
MAGIQVTSGPLFWAIVGLAVLVFAAVEALLVASALRSPADGAQDSEGARRPRSRSWRATEVAWTLLPALLLLALLVASARALR